jgi:hypothetical protein
MIEGTLAAELTGRAAVYQAEVAASLERWRRERLERWDALRGRIEALTMRLGAARRDFRRSLGTMPTPSRRDVGAMLRWLGRFEVERQRFEDEIWSQLRATRQEDALWRAEVERKAAALDELGRRLAREAEGALADALAAGRARIGETPAGRALARQLAQARQLLARRLEELGAEVDERLGTLGARSFAEPGQLLGRFEDAVTARLGGGGAPVARVARSPATARAAARPDRKKARVPRFVLSRFYRPGGLRLAGEGVEITFTNPLGFCIIQGGDAVMVDGRPFPKEQTLLDNGERRVRGAELSGADCLKFPKGGEIRVTLRGLDLPPGPHRFLCSLELRKMGWVELNVTDRVS